MDLDEILDGIQDEGAAVLKEEVKGLFLQAKTDGSAFIRETALQLETLLLYRAQGLLDEDDVRTFLVQQKIIVEVEKNLADMVTRARLEKVTSRLLDITLTVLLKTIIPL